jgi:hypothetical protein
MKKFILSIALVFTAISCKEDIYSTIPRADVYLLLKLDLYDNNLKVPLAYSIFTIEKYPDERPRSGLDKLGYGGILVVHGIDEINGGSINLCAYDMACPVEASRNARIAPINLNQTGIPTAVTAKCSKCGAIYDLMSGAPQSGSKYYLRAYQVAKTGSSGEYKIWN